ncbi:hypothetical protein V3C33_01710 [Micrococcaceae bacterium Sec5.7]
MNAIPKSGRIPAGSARCPHKPLPTLPCDIWPVAARVIQPAGANGAVEVSGPFAPAGVPMDQFKSTGRPASNRRFMSSMIFASSL